MVGFLLDDRGVILKFAFLILFGRINILLHWTFRLWLNNLWWSRAKLVEVFPVGFELLPLIISGSALVDRGVESIWFLYQALIGFWYRYQTPCRQKG